MMLPDPKHLQQNLLFYVIYYFCQCGRENLYEMTTDTFRLVTELDDTEYVIQDTDEMDKNHGFEDTNKTKEGKMFATGCKFKFCKFLIWVKNLLI